MKINIYYGGRGIVGDPTVHVIEKVQEILEELHVKVERYNLHEYNKQISTLPGTLNDADGIILASTVEWYGIGGYMYQFLDSCWLYGNKEKISHIYMCPIVMSTAYGEREGMSALSVAWEVLGGLPCEGICGYAADVTAFELNQDYTKLIERKAENIYRTISQKMVSMPASNQAVRGQASSQSPLKLTPQETEQLSKYAADEQYVKTQKEDIKELASHFRNILGSDTPLDTEDKTIKKLREHFVPQKNFEASYKFVINGEKSALILRIKNDKLDAEYGTIDNPTVTCTLSSEKLFELTEGRMTFQKAFMMGDMQVKGDFKILRMLDQIFVIQ